MPCSSAEQGAEGTQQIAAALGEMGCYIEKITDVYWRLGDLLRELEGKPKCPGR